MIQSIREIPGFLALLAVFVIRYIREHRLSALSILLLARDWPPPVCCPRLPDWL